MCVYVLACVSSSTGYRCTITNGIYTIGAAHSQPLVSGQRLLIGLLRQLFTEALDERRGRDTSADKNYVQTNKHKKECIKDVSVA